METGEINRTDSIELKEGDEQRLLLDSDIIHVSGEHAKLTLGLVRDHTRLNFDGIKDVDITVKNPKGYGFTIYASGRDNRYVVEVGRGGAELELHGGNNNQFTVKENPRSSNGVVGAVYKRFYGGEGNSVTPVGENIRVY